MSTRWFGSWFNPKNNSSIYTGNTAVIIGAANAIGKAVALKCVIDEGINVAIVDIENNKQSLYALEKELKAKSNMNHGILQIESFCVSNFNDLKQIENLISCIKKKFSTNSIQFLFNNIDTLLIGHNSAEIPRILPLVGNESHKNDKLRNMMDFNFWSILSVTRLFLPLLVSEENIEKGKRCFIINTSSLKSAYSLSDTMYSITKYCMHSLSEVMKYEIDVMLDEIKLNKNENILFDLRLKIICPGFIEENDEYTLVNMMHKYEQLESVENMKKIMKVLEISIEEFGDIIFDGIYNDDIFVILDHLNIFRIYSTDRLTTINKQNETIRHLFTKRLFKSILSKL